MMSKIVFDNKISTIITEDLDGSVNNKSITRKSAITNGSPVH